MRYLLSILCFCLVFCAANSQDSLLVTKNFRFADGIYYNLEQLHQSQPALPLEELTVHYFTNPQTSLTQLDSIFIKKSKKPVSLDSIWMICLDGVPSIRVPKHEINRELPNFAAMKLRGKICYFTYPDYRKRKVRVAAYNPMTGRPFRQGYVEREEEVFVEKMLDFNSGKVADFNTQNLIGWIKNDDPLLVETLTEMPVEEQQEKLFKCLLIYVDRNPAFVVKMMNDK
ncbi:MAG: hypothetical protein IT258_01570 [Saprospiraceae bacterium]|nr:hypothetical protein [Saprospiraceae bacterium]